MHPSRITRDPCPQPGIAEVAVPSSPRTHVHTPHSPEGPNHLFIKMLCIPDPKHKPAMPAGGLGKVKGVKSPNPRHQHVPIKAHEFMSKLEKVSGMKRSVFCFIALCFLCCPNKV